MSTMLRRILLIGLPLVAFLAIGYFDADRRATQLQDSAHARFETCDSLKALSGEGSAEHNRCLSETRSALEASSGTAMIAALPLALGSAAVVLILLLLVLRRRRETPQS